MKQAQQKVLIHLTFASLPESRSNPVSLITSAACNLVIIVVLFVIGAATVHHISQQKYNVTHLYAPIDATFTPPAIKFKMPVVPKQQIAKMIALPKLESPKLESPKIQAQPIEHHDVKPISLPNAIPEIHPTVSKPQIVLAPQAKAAMPVVQARSAEQPTRGTVMLSQFATAQAHKGRVAAAGWPGAHTAATPFQQSHPASVSFKPIEVLSGPKPEYTPEARQSHIQGSVVLRVLVSASGRISVLNVIHSLGYGLDEAAKRAVVQYRVKPALRDGVPTDQTTTITITFVMA
jgi:TonB family protein